MFPSQLTWSRDILKSAATGKKTVIIWDKYQQARTNILLLDIGPNHAHDIAEIIFKKICRCQSIYWEVGNKLRSLYSPKPQGQQIDVYIIDTGQLVCQSLSVLQFLGSATPHGRCPMKACHLPLPEDILQ